LPLDHGRRGDRSKFPSRAVLVRRTESAGWPGRPRGAGGCGTIELASSYALQHHQRNQYGDAPRGRNSRSLGAIESNLPSPCADEYSNAIRSASAASRAGCRGRTSPSAVNRFRVATLVSTPPHPI
jgi:hypothetical protein